MSQLKALVDKLLTNVSNAYIPEGYISEEVLPTLSVKQKTGKIGKYGTSHLRIVNSKMGGRGKAPRFEPIVREVDDTYSIESHGLEGMVTEDDYSNVEEPFDAERDETLGLTSAIWLEKEFAFASTITNTSVVTQNTTIVAATDKLSDYTNSKPLELFRDSQNVVLNGCGFMPNRAIISQKMFNVLKYHPAILRTLGFADARAGQLSTQELAKAMGVDILHVGKVSYEAAKLGQATDFKQLWGNDIVFYYAPRTAEKYQKSLGYYMTLSGRGPRRVYKYSIDNPPNSKGIIVQDDYSFEILDAKCAYLIKNAI
jgi:hypothetical protein